MLGKAQTNAVDSDNNPLTQEKLQEMLRVSAGKLKHFFEAPRGCCPHNSLGKRMHLDGRIVTHGPHGLDLACLWKEWPSGISRAFL